MGYNDPVRDKCEVIYEIFHILNCGFEIKHAMIIAVMNPCPRDTGAVNRNGCHKIVSSSVSS